MKVDRMKVDRTARRSLGIVLGALVVSSLMLAQPVAGLSWAPPVVVSTDTAAAWAPALAVTGPLSAAAVFREKVAGTAEIRVARTLDGGVSWLPPVTVSSLGVAAVTRATIVGSGQTVDATWSEGANCFTGPCELRYARSDDGGASFGPSQRLSAASGMAGQAAVARSGLKVVVAWTDAPSRKVFARASADGGLTFKPARVLGTTTNVQYPSGGVEAYPVLAWCGPVLVSAAIMTPTKLAARRSSDGGGTWAGPTVIATNAAAAVAPSVACKGKAAVLAYGRRTSGVTWLAYRRSTDRGVTWKPAAVLAPAASMAADAPVIAVAGPTFAALFLRCGDAACTAGTGGEGATYLRTSASGATWSAPQQVASPPGVISRPVGLGRAGALLALVTSLDTTTWTSQLESRRGT
jgi:hypothetical protein